MTIRPHDYAAWEAEVSRLELDHLPPLPEEEWIHRCERTIREGREPVSSGLDSGADLASRIVDHQDAPDGSQRWLPLLAVGTIAFIGILAAPLPTEGCYWALIALTGGLATWARRLLE